MQNHHAKSGKKNQEGVIIRGCRLETRGKPGITWTERQNQTSQTGSSSSSGSGSSGSSSSSCSSVLCSSVQMRWQSTLLIEHDMTNADVTSNWESVYMQHVSKFNVEWSSKMTLTTLQVYLATHTSVTHSTTTTTTTSVPSNTHIHQSHTAQPLLLQQVYLATHTHISHTAQPLLQIMSKCLWWFSPSTQCHIVKFLANTNVVSSQHDSWVCLWMSKISKAQKSHPPPSFFAAHCNGVSWWCLVGFYCNFWYLQYIMLFGSMDLGLPSRIQMKPTIDSSSSLSLSLSLSSNIHFPGGPG